MSTVNISTNLHKNNREDHKATRKEVFFFDNARSVYPPNVFMLMFQGWSNDIAA